MMSSLPESMSRPAILTTTEPSRPYTQNTRANEVFPRSGSRKASRMFIAACSPISPFKRASPLFSLRTFGRLYRADPFRRNRSTRSLVALAGHHHAIRRTVLDRQTCVDGRCPISHAIESQPAAMCLGPRESGSIICNFDSNQCRFDLERHDDVLSVGVFQRVVEGFLNDPVQLIEGLLRERERRAVADAN